MSAGKTRCQNYNVLPRQTEGCAPSFKVCLCLTGFPSDHHVVLQCWLEKCTMACIRFQNSKESNLTQLIAADIRTFCLYSCVIMRCHMMSYRQTEGSALSLNTFCTTEWGSCSLQLCSRRLQNEGLIPRTLLLLSWKTARLKLVSKQTSFRWRKRTLSLPIASFWCSNWWKYDGYSKTY